MHSLLSYLSRGPAFPVSAKDVHLASRKQQLYNFIVPALGSMNYGITTVSNWQVNERSDLDKLDEFSTFNHAF